MVKVFLPHFILLCAVSLITDSSYGQLKWQNVDSLFQPLPSSVHIYRSVSLLDGKPNTAYYIEADLKSKKIEFTTDTTFQRRLTPSGFYEKNNKALVVVNTTFFSFANNQNLNVVVKNGKLLAYNPPRFRKSRADTSIKAAVYASAIGISKRRNADVVWTRTDSVKMSVEASQVADPEKRYTRKRTNRSTGMITPFEPNRAFIPWRVRTAVGGGPVLLQGGEIQISNNEELKFAGKAIDDKHPRTAMGYTNDRKLIIMVVEGRNQGKAEGATLTQLAQMFKDLGCHEALNLDGGGSSCMLVNGKETIKVSDATGQRPVPAVFIIQYKE